MTSKTITCIVCPVGCQLEITLDEQGKVNSITGNTCKRGYAYAESEFTNPTRTLTSTVKLVGAETDILLPVRTAAPIPKGKLLEAMAALKSITVSAPIKVGDIVCEDLVGTGIALTACRTVDAASK